MPADRAPRAARAGARTPGRARARRTSRAGAAGTAAPSGRVEPGLLGIIGHPVRRSLSPAMQQAALRSCGLDARYLAFDLSAADVRAVLRALPALGFWGLNVTIPYKETVLRLVDRLDPEAAAIGAVNTIVVRAGRLEGHNTDARGFLRALAAGGAQVRGRRVLLVGAGGAARAIAHACLRAGCRALVVANRTPARAGALCRALAAGFPDAEVAGVAAAGPRWADTVAASDLVVNATPLGGRAADPLPVPAAALRRGQTVADIVYRPRVTPLLAAARAAGAATVGGLEMLLHQGALAFALWTGRAAPLPAMRRALARAAAAGEGPGRGSTPA